MPEENEVIDIINNELYRNYTAGEIHRVGVPEIHGSQTNNPFLSEPSYITHRLEGMDELIAATKELAEAMHELSMVIGASK